MSWYLHYLKGRKEVRIELYDMKGAVIASRTVTDNAEVVEINTKHLPDGSYAWRVYVAGNVVQVGKALKGK